MSSIKGATAEPDSDPDPDADSDAEGCPSSSALVISLEQILKSFGAAISEAWAFAIIHQACQTLDRLLRHPEEGGTRPDDLSAVEDPNHLLIHANGHVDKRSFMSNSGQNRSKFISEGKTVSELALVIYSALDFGLKKHDERKLTDELQDILEHMLTYSDESHVDDEGVHCDEDEPKGSRQAAKKIMEECTSNLSVPSEARTHFPAVCRAMVSETLELSTFMEKVAQFDKEKAEELRELDMQDWARLWISCMRDLRNGVKLKKTNYTKTPVEYELTPYEILMDDIRSKRYKLNKVMVDGDIPPKIKKNAHDIILDFIRSRPPLRPASERALGPLNQESTPIEKLMESIRNSSSRASLRKTPGPVVKQTLQSSDTMASKRTAKDSAESDKVQDNRKPIRPNPSEVDDLLNFEDLDFDDETASEASTAFSRQTSRDSNHSDLLEMEIGRADSRYGVARVARDLALHGSSPGSTWVSSLRRHSLSLCESDMDDIIFRRQKKIYIKSDSTSSSSTDVSSSTDRESCKTPVPASTVVEEQRVRRRSEEGYTINTPQMHASLQSELFLSQTRDRWPRIQEYNGNGPVGRVYQQDFQSCTRTVPEVRFEDVSSDATSKEDSIKAIMSQWRSELQTQSDSLPPILEEAGEEDDHDDAGGATIPMDDEMTLEARSLTGRAELKRQLSRMVSLLVPRHKAGPRQPQLEKSASLPDGSRDDWNNALRTLDLTLDEVIHIRSILAKAELEGLPLDGSLKEDVEKGRVCFLCMKTRFGFFTWGVRCQLCKQQVCVKCSHKMRIPTEYFGNVPTSVLKDFKQDYSEAHSRGGGRRGRGSLKYRNSVGSAPSSPEFKRRHPSHHRGEKQDNDELDKTMLPETTTTDQDESDGVFSIFSSGPTSLPVTAASDKKMSAEEKLKGPRLQVCSDCREMILQVIRAQSTAKRFQMQRALYKDDAKKQKFAKEEVF